MIDYFCILEHRMYLDNLNRLFINFVNAYQFYVLVCWFQLNNFFYYFYIPNATFCNYHLSFEYLRTPIAWESWHFMNVSFWNMNCVSRLVIRTSRISINYAFQCTIHIFSLHCFILPLSKADQLSHPFGILYFIDLSNKNSKMRNK